MPSIYTPTIGCCRHDVTDKHQRAPFPRLPAPPPPAPASAEELAASPPTPAPSPVELGPAPVADDGRNGPRNGLPRENGDGDDASPAPASPSPPAVDDIEAALEEERHPRNTLGPRAAAPPAPPDHPVPHVAVPLLSARLLLHAREGSEEARFRGPPVADDSQGFPATWKAVDDEGVALAS